MSEETCESAESAGESSTSAERAEPMSSSYADGLSPYEHKGKLGLNEIFDSPEEVENKVKILAEWVKEAKHVVFHTGAGISTSAGIPDFRGPQGVWTLEAKGEKPKINKSFNDVLPTKTHMAIKQLIDCGSAKFVISQNIDGLHLRSGIKREDMAELHGNMFTEQCDKCNGLFVRCSATTSVGCKYLGKTCPGKKGRQCRGKIKDTILDWEHNLPENELMMAEWHSNLADLSIALGTTMQIIPSGNLPLLAKKRGGKLVVCNLQPTKNDKKADLVIHTYVDRVMERLLQLLEMEEVPFNEANDPTKKASNSVISWDFSRTVMNNTKRLYTDLCTNLGKRSKLAKGADEEEKEAKKEKQDEEEVKTEQDKSTEEKKSETTSTDNESVDIDRGNIKKEENEDDLEQVESQ